MIVVLFMVIAAIIPLVRLSTANERIRQFFLELTQERSVLEIFLNFSANVASRMEKLLDRVRVTEQHAIKSRTVQLET